MFSRLTNSMKLFPILCDASRSCKFKTASSKEEILITQHVYNIVSKLLMLYTCILRLQNSAKRSPTSCNTSRHQQSKMAGNKPEILISQPVYNIAAQFQRLFLRFWGPGIQRSYSLLCVMRAEGKHPRWRLTNKLLCL